MKYGPGLKVLYMFMAGIRLRLPIIRIKIFHRPRKVTVVVLNEDSIAVSKALALERQKNDLILIKEANDHRVFVELSMPCRILQSNKLQQRS